MAIHLVPAYGRIYDNAPSAWEAWENGKDFRIAGGPYCSIRDVAAMVDDFEMLLIHYAWPHDAGATIQVR